MIQSPDDFNRPQQWQRVLTYYRELVVAHLEAQERFERARCAYQRAMRDCQDTAAHVAAERRSHEAAMRVHEALRAEVRTTVQYLRAQEIPPERVLRVVRETLRESCDPGTRAARYEDLARLSSDVGQWVIEDYFAA